MAAAKQKCPTIDPRTGLLLLVLANIIAFSEKNLWVELGWVCALAALFLICGCVKTGLCWLAGFCLLLVFQAVVLPVSPKIIATSFSIFANYARRMFPCLMVGSLMLKTISLRRFVVGLRRLHLPQTLIIPISVTLRYFPAIKEETGYIRDAMRLRSIRGLEKVEALIVPLMISATGTAEELSAAAVTRGIENPAPKTTTVVLQMGALDTIALLVAAAFAGAALLGG